MSEMFDVDCPRTPDEDNKDGAPTSAIKENSNMKPPIVRRSPSAAKVSSRPANNTEEGIEVSLPTTSATNQYTPRSNKSKQLFSPRPRGGKGSSSSTRRGNGHRYKSSNKVGLEPEEFIINNKPKPLPPRHSSATTAMTPRTPNAPHTPGNSRGHKEMQPNSSDGASVNMSQLNLTQQQDTSLNNKSAHHMNNRPRTHSTEAFGGNPSNNIDDDDDDDDDIVGGGIGSNPFDGDTIDGGGRYIGPPLTKKKPTMSMNTRSNSRGYWTEEIIDEEDDKGAAMDQYYGLNATTRNELYGPPPTNMSDVEQGGHQSIMNPRTPGSNPRTPGNHMVNQATTTPGGGAGVIDDYSFSNVNLSSPTGVVSSPGGVVSPGQPQSGSTSNTFLSSVFQVFASNDKNSGYAPPQDLNPHDNSQFNPNGINKRKGLLSRLTPPQKMGLGVLWMVVVCTIFGVTIGQLKKANQAIPLPNGGGSGASQANGMDGIQLAPPVKDFPTFSPTWEETPVPTPSPSDSPTLQPTTEEPTLNPITPSPIAGYHGIHGKANSGTVHPTRSPITSAPSDAPTTSSPSNSPSTSPTVDVEAAKRAWCAEPDATGEYLNHNDVLKTCTWLNIKEGLTDRKDKNCGGREVVDTVNGGLIIYETTDLGDVCRQTCYLYNGCDQVEDEAVEEELQLAPPVLVEEGLSNMAVMSETTTSISSECQDGSNPYGYKNHLDNFKTCEWLHNDKDGQTDRKDKNCGTKEYEITQLGEACKYTCAAAEYITNSGCLLIDGNVVHVSSSMNGVQIMRSFSSPSYEFSVSSSANEEEESP